MTDQTFPEIDLGIGDIPISTINIIKVSNILA